MAKDKKKKGTAAGEDSVSTRDAAPELYTTVECEGVAEFEEKKSVFIGHCARVTNEEDAAAYVKQLKKQYADARHNVWAYLLRGGIVARYSDDGEPQGTAGIPCLDVLLKEDVTDCCVVVTRYFGGIMLGAGGLVRAYSHGAKIALDSGGIITMSLCKIVKATADYNFYGRLVPLICEGGGIVEDTEFTDNVTVTFRMPEDLVGSFRARLIDVSNGRFDCEVVDERFCEI